MEKIKLKKLKPIFLNSENKEVDIKFIDKLIEKENNIIKKNFLRGCKHILEKHYTEAIKWFQLADEFNDSILLILFLSLKLGDVFLFKEYFTENLEVGDIFFKEIDIKPFIEYENELNVLDMNFIKNLAIKLGGENWLR
jgi:hypothetical protein